MMLPEQDSARVAHLRTVVEDIHRGKPRCVGLLGLGVAGREMALYAAECGARVIGADDRENVSCSHLRTSGVQLRLGGSDDPFEDIDLLVLSPGVSPTHPWVRGALSRNVPVCGELELTWPLPAPAVGITGTNGKSTTTALLGTLLRNAGRRAFVGGNLGEPITSWVRRKEAVDVAVLELSSFQLETAYDFRARVAVVLNVTPDHTDRYPTMQAYADTKRRLVERTASGGVAILNCDDPYVRAMGAASPGLVWWFSADGNVLPAPRTGAVVHDDMLHFCGELEDRSPISLAHPRLFGRHNRENTLAAMLAATALDISPQELGHGYRIFEGLAHRLQWVDEIEGVRYINDSKATNDESAAVAVRALSEKEPRIILLAGGRDKGAGYEQLKAAALGHVKLIVAFGEARGEIASGLGGVAHIERVVSLKDALVVARRQAHPGDTVLLAPACSSFDAFENFAERGQYFIDLVRALPRGQGAQHG